jgi:hypothetical protein
MAVCISGGEVLSAALYITGVSACIVKCSPEEFI